MASALEPAALSPRSPLSHYYVYYRLRADIDHQDARRRVLAMQQTLAAHTGVIGTLMVRVDDDTTWMEVYAPVADAGAFEQALQQAVADAAIDALIEPGSARHIERFAAIGAQH